MSHYKLYIRKFLKKLEEKTEREGTYIFTY